MLSYGILGSNTKIVKLCIYVGRVEIRGSVAVLIKKFFEHFEGISAHGIFHGITD